jgi:hypothetical protein
MADSPGERAAPRQPAARRDGEIAAFLGLGEADRKHRLRILYGKTQHVADEVVCSLMLQAWREDWRDADAYSAEVIRRVAKHVRAHARKNPGWSQLGGGLKAVVDDFCGAVLIAMVGDSADPCYAEVAFGDFVYRRCLDCADKLYALKHSGGISLDDEESTEAQVQQASTSDLSSGQRSPEQLLIELEEELLQSFQLEKIKGLVQTDLPELQRNAFSFRYYGLMKIESKNPSELTVVRMMGCTEKTASKYIRQALATIIERLKS